VIEGGGGLRFTPEPLLRLVAQEEPLGKELERHPAAEPRILGLVDDTHAPAAELLEHAIVGDGLADHITP
jgi:hypothetical protein